MMKNKLVKISLFVAFSLLLSACTNAAPTQDPAQAATQVAAQVEAQVATRVAQAMTAFNATQKAQPTKPPILPTVGTNPTLATVNLPTVGPLPGVPTGVPCNPPPLNMGENYPDGTAIYINTAFDKSWTLQNAGTCTWNANYKIKFISGDAMSGPAFKLFGASVRPGESLKLTLPLKTPGAVGTTTGRWGLYDDKDAYFGWVSVVINSITVAPTSATFRVTSVVIAKNAGTCTFTATIAANAAGTVTYTWYSSPAAISYTAGTTASLSYPGAGSQIVSSSLPIGTTNVRLYVVPNNQDFDSPTVAACP
jgi:hypothetical protein